uniref:B30.2/SPRY domain-containing protein n=1 Tax=Aplanochytrium stocchinoi TaxID=215587 RepID=A0A7S3V0W9_9STRA|mmetsp:Transcript_5415/g.7075  ORF Transcript_5415/g.7075 Transcript_5415/m.7075 type:complete len:498 (+) Transcript_5415:81-1574(+)|eukprot:CAMPEP_0204826026 /NCGR_PEP_ID=MMETSP1346-20131115/3785_1 /ASSEMBLY_ACC=CAM_ASM_000771 /TAXON_ID=215587 /ORGANISM="Aplanochytrium stocchinoi, Strain GSBS06" /LENGTH=497 /DNA_ID=CAMNT_0051953853 /DNA_START=252 /DNA_END=1745 /DNA_ORIENTATION=+
MSSRFAANSNNSLGTTGANEKANDKFEKTSAVDVVENQSACPSGLDGNTASELVRVDCDELTVSYLGVGNHNEDYGCVQSKQPVPSDSYMYYFEVTVLNIGYSGNISIGLAPSPPGKCQLGTRPQAIGYCAGSRTLYKGASKGVITIDASVLVNKDVLGCGINMDTGIVFFTRNGRRLEALETEHEFEGEQEDIYPTISMHSSEESVRVNFGAFPFKYDISECMDQYKLEREKRLSQILLSSCDVIPLVKEYLCFHGYMNTLEKLIESDECNLDKIENENGIKGNLESISQDVQSKTTGQKPKSQENKLIRNEDLRSDIASFMENSKLKIRSEIRECIVNGKPLRALEMINKHFPDLEKDYKGDAFIHLYCQHFIELMRDDKVEDAVEYAREELSKYANSNPEHMQLVSPILGLIAFRNADESPVARFLKPERKLFVADTINLVILESMFEESKRSKLENCVINLAASKFIKKYSLGGRGPKFSVEKELGYSQHSTS